ncbi:MAG: complex I 51 kDa subunit family protein, partial [Gaiellaceae bacterium]
MARRELLLQHADERDLTQLAEYEAVGGYASLRKALGMERQAVLDELLAANVRGRGGAGFPMGRKASFLPKPGDTPKPIYLVVNADESEPGTFKDRELMLRVPHTFVEGIVIASYTIGAGHAFVYVRGEYLTEYEVLVAALEEARASGYVGKDVLDSGWDLTVVVHRGAGAYICGEETGLLESLEGNRGQPRTKPPFPAISGLYASPTLINNVETLATVPKILELGGKKYARIGVENSAGTRVFSLSGNVVRGGNYELELGTTLRELIYDIGGGIPDGRELKAIIPGGSSVPVLGAAQVDAALDFDSMAEAG